MTEKHVIITGAASGIGAALTTALAADGYRLHICARRVDRLAAVSKEGALANYQTCDVSDEDSVKRFIASVSSRTNKVHAVITCAGGFGAIGPMLETDSVEWWDTLKVNVLGSYLIAKHARHLLGQGSRIVNFSGGGAFNPFPNYSAYATSKAAIVRMTENLAVELADQGIYVNAVAPGFVLTEIHDATMNVGRDKAGDLHFQQTLAKQKEGAVPIEVPVNLVRWLLSERSSGLTGKTISASFDPWDAKAFSENIDAIVASDLYTMRRINLAQLEPCPLKETLINVRGQE